MELVTTLISHLKISSLKQKIKDSSSHGFTLIEVMIVIAILAALVSLGAPRLFKKENNFKAIARNFITLSKEIRDKARLQGLTYRLAIEVGKDGGSYWVENSSRTVSIDQAIKDSEKKADESRSSKDDPPPPPLFKKDTAILKKVKALPSTMRFASVETINMQRPQTEGTAYIYFFSEGFVEAATLQVAAKDKGGVWTVVFNPLTGRADIIDKALSLKESKQ